MLPSSAFTMTLPFQAMTWRPYSAAMSYRRKEERI